MRRNTFDAMRWGVVALTGYCLVLGLHGATSVMAQEVIYPSADGSLVDGGEYGPFDGVSDASDWTFNQSGYEGVITLVTAPEEDRLEHRLVWEYDLSDIVAAPPVSATLTFTVRGRAAFPIPDVNVHVYAYPADLVETPADYGAGPAVLQCSLPVVAYEEVTYTVAVTDAVGSALQNGDNGVGFRFQISPGTENGANQAFIDALETDLTTKPFLTIREALSADADGDGVPDDDDFCAGFDDRFDVDSDGFADGCDNCPDDPNVDQADSDGDGVGDVCSDASPPPPDDGGGNDGGGTVGGGGPPPQQPTPEPDTTDGLGRFTGQVTGDDGRVLAEVDISGAAPGLLVSYELVDSPSMNDAPGSDGGSFAGFGDGGAVGRTFTLDIDALPGSFTAEIVIRFTDGELSEANVRASEVALHVWDTTQRPSMWVPAGDDVGSSQSTGVVGDSGYYRDTDRSWVFWAVRDELSSFAVGAPWIAATVDDVEPAEIDEPDEDEQTPDVEAPAPDETLATDTDRDGVSDDFDLCPRTARGAIVDLDGCPIEEPQLHDVPVAVAAPTSVRGGGLCGLFGMISLSLTFLGLGQMKLTIRARRRATTEGSLPGW